MLRALSAKTDEISLIGLGLGLPYRNKSIIIINLLSIFYVAN